jgi:hypothetical protein
MTEHIPFSILAAEAEAVPTNLDRLPPGVVRKNKRKSEPIAPRGQNKRPRGSRGGIIGRPRKSEQVGAAPAQETSELTEETTASKRYPKPVSASPPRMSTRQVKRQSIATTAPEASPEKATAGVPVKKEQKVSNSEGETMIDAEENKDGESTIQLDVPETSPIAQIVDKKTPGRPRKKTDPDSVTSKSTSAKKSAKNKSSATKQQKPSSTAVSAVSKQNKEVNGTKSRSKGELMPSGSMNLLTLPSPQDESSGLQ